MFASCLLLVLTASVVSATVQIALPPGVQTEGVTAAAGDAYFAGDLRSGAVFLVDARSRLVTTAVPGTDGGSAVGLFAAKGKLFVAGGGGSESPPGTSGPVSATIKVYDIPTGANLTACSVDGSGFVNDVVTVGNYAYYTDSFRPFLYRLALRDVSKCDITKIPLPRPAFKNEDFVFRSNGVARYRNGVILANSDEATLFFVDVEEGNKVRAVTPRGRFAFVDGIAVVYTKGGPFLYVTQNRLQTVSEWKLRMRGGRQVSAMFVRNITSPAFDFPTTVAVVEDTLVVANARFDDANPGEPLPEGFVTSLGVTHI